MTSLTPTIYLACDKAYKADRLIGKWVDASLDAASLETKAAEVANMSLYRKDDWYIHRYGRGFYKVDLGKKPDLQLVSLVSRGIEEYGESFAAYIQLTGIREGRDYEKEYLDSYLGQATNKEEFAENYFSSWYEDVAGVNWKVVARKMFSEGLALIKSREHSLIYVFTK